MHTTARARTSRLLTALGMAGALLSMATPGFAAVTPATLTLSSTQGPNTGGNMITASVPAGSTQFFPGVDVEFQVAASASTACTPLYAAPVSPTSSAGGIIDVPFAMVVSATRLAINVPGFGPAPLTSKYNVCVYSTNNSTGQLLAQTTSAGQYSIGTRVSVGNVWPTSGPAQGGTTITVFGNNLPTTTPSGLTATLGGLPLNITVLGNNSFTAVTPPHAPSPTPVPLVVNSPGGTTIIARAFTYANGITVSPSTAPNTRMGGTSVDVQGVGFAGLNFMMTGNPDDKNSHVYLVRGLYDPANNGGAKRNGELVECANPMLISDTELVCMMNLQASLTSTGTTALPTRTITADTHTDTSLANISPALSPSDQGERISGTGIAPGTTIAAVGAGGTSATLSTPTLATATGVTGIAVGIGTATATVTAPSPNSNPGPPMTAISPPLTQADVGRTVTGTGIPPGTTIINVSQDGTTASLSTQPMSTATGTITISDPVPVPVGAYFVTVVSNGTVGAWPADPNYTQSVISGGATFTVSDF